MSDERIPAARPPVSPQRDFAGRDAASSRCENPTPEPASERSKEYGGRKGPDPVRYGDWEKDGRCIDF